MKGRGEHPVDVTRGRLVAAKRKAALASLDYTSVDAQQMFACLRGQCIATLRLIDEVDDAPTKPMRLLAVRMVEAYETAVRWTIDGVKSHAATTARLLDAEARPVHAHHPAPDTSAS